ALGDAGLDLRGLARVDAHFCLLLAAARLLLLARVLLAPDGAEFLELSGVVAHGALARFAGVRAVVAAGNLAGILGSLVQGNEALGDEAEGEVIQCGGGAFELARVPDRPGRFELARLDAESAIHALSHVDVEAAHGLLLRRRILHEVDRNAL